MIRISRPASRQDVATSSGEIRAGGTDVHARTRLGGNQAGSLVDIRGVADLRGIRPMQDGGWWIRAMERISAVVTHKGIATAYPALVATAGSLANPHIRQVATIGGNLLQRTRCPYYRHVEIDCYKSGGSGCPAREDDHSHGIVFDVGPCVAPHPSSIAMALLTYDGVSLSIHGKATRSVADLYGDGSDPTRDHSLDAGELLVGVELPPPTHGERASYWRAGTRALAEWALVEAVCRLTITDGRFDLVNVAVGGVATVPMRLTGVEAALRGKPTAFETIRSAAHRAADDANPLPQTAYKIALLNGAVEHVLQAAAAGESHTEAAPHERGLGSDFIRGD